MILDYFIPSVRRLKKLSKAMKLIVNESESYFDLKEQRQLNLLMQKFFKALDDKRKQEKADRLAKKPI